jgi:thiosulfate dehydrogenase
VRLTTKTTLFFVLSSVAAALLVFLAMREGVDRVLEQETTADSVHRPAHPIPEGPEGDAIRRGLEIVTRTYEILPEHAKNGLHCTSCHLEGGTKANAGPWIGLLSVFPEYRARSGQVDPIERRINDCFERSMNGVALDPASDDMAAIVAYMAFISQGVPKGATPGRSFSRIQNPPTPDRNAGARLYEQKCAACHGANGEGRKNGEAYLFPALSGPESFNIGAGMARLDTAAAYIRWNMPLGLGGTLTDQESYSIADFFVHFDRPDFAGKDEDWPQGGKPRDARY